MAINKLLAYRHRLLSIIVPVIFTLPLVSLAPALAASDGHFTLSPASGSHTVGSTLVVTVSETSAAGDNTNAVQANLSYPASLLSYKSINLNGPFTLCGQQTGGSGSVNIGCAATGAQSSTQNVAQISFTVLAVGTAPISMTSGSDIDDTGGNSVWNGLLPSVTYSLASPSKPKSSTPPSSSKTSGSTSSKTKKSTGPATTEPIVVKPPSTPHTEPSTITSATNAFSITITDSLSKPIKNARVTLDNHFTEYTDAQGKAGFSSVESGSHTIVATAAGKKSEQTKLAVTTNQDKQISLRLANASMVGSALIIGSTLSILLVSAILVWYFRFFRGRLPAVPHNPNAITSAQPVLHTTPVVADTVFTPGTTTSPTVTSPLIATLPAIPVAPAPVVMQPPITPALPTPIVKPPEQASVTPPPTEESATPLVAPEPPRAAPAATEPPVEPMPAPVTPLSAAEPAPTPEPELTLPKPKAPPGPPPSISKHEESSLR